MSVALQIRMLCHNGRLILSCGSLTLLICERIKIDLPLDALKLFIEIFDLVLEELTVLSSVVIKDRVQELINTGYPMVLIFRGN